VNLDSSTFLGLEVVNAVEIMWLRDGVLQAGRPGCASLPAAPGQTVFSCSTDFLVEHVGPQVFYAFLEVDLGGAIPLRFEVASNSAAELLVSAGAPNVRLSSRSHSMEVGTFFETDPVGTEPNFSFSVDALEPYGGLVAPGAQTVTRENSGTFDGQAQIVNVTFEADGEGRVTGIQGSANVQAETTLTGCSSSCEEVVFGGRSDAAVDTAILFTVEVLPVAYELGGTLEVETDDRNPARGTLVLEDLSQAIPLELFSVCEGALPGACFAGVPATAQFLTTGVLEPGVYRLTFHLSGAAQAVNPDLFYESMSREATGSGQFSLTLASAE
jgi:hypothetical protein